MTLGDRIVVMSDGEVQQIDTPQNLYDSPVNKFVAGFIGAPQMNFIEATLKEKGNDVFVTIADHDVKLAEDKAARLKKKGYKDGQEVTVGIRPEDLGDSPEMLAKFPHSKVKGHVDVYEMLGSTSNLYVNVNGQQITATVEPDTPVRVGDTIELAFDNNKIHIFDKDTQENVLVDIDPTTGELVH